MQKRVISVALAASLAACATPYSPIPYDRTSAGVEKVMIIDDAFPDELTTQKLATNGQNMASAMAASAGLAGVLIGAAIAGVEAGIESGQRDRIRAAIGEFDGEAIFDAALEEALETDGYTLETVEMTRKSNMAYVELVADAEAEPGTAVLDIAGAGYGFQLVSGNTSWRPFVRVGVQMSDSANPELIHLENKVAYNPVATPDVIVNIEADPKYAFNKIEDIEANPELAREGLEAALIASAQGVAQLLK